MSLDLALSRAITMIHILEKAVHDQGFWTLDCDDMTVPALREIHGNRVEFVSEFPAVALTRDQSLTLTLRCDGDHVFSREIDSSDCTGNDLFAVSLVLSIPEEVPA